MEAREAAQASANAVAHLAGGFMLDPATYGHGADLGYPGMSFYFTGRGGVLGPVDADVVAATFALFNPDTVRENWQPYRDTDLAHASREFLACGVTWAQRFPDDLDVARLGELAGKVIADTNPAGAPLFAAWRAVDEPDDPKGLTLHRMNVLRELRGNLHGAAVLAAGMTPLQALAVKTPYMAPIFGWQDELPDADACRGAWDQAEEMTNLMMAPAFASLTSDEREEFVALSAEAYAATK